MFQFLLTQIRKLKTAISSMNTAEISSQIGFSFTGLTGLPPKAYKTGDIITVSIAGTFNNSAPSALRVLSDIPADYRPKVNVCCGLIFEKIGSSTVMHNVIVTTDGIAYSDIQFTSGSSNYSYGTISWVV